MTRVLLTGASGFLGRHTAAALEQSGFSVRALLRTPQPGPWTEHALGDVCDSGSLGHALVDCDIVVHAAGKVSRNADDTERLHRVHVEGTHKLLEASVAAGVKRFVHISTSGTLAVSENPYGVGTEQSAPPPGLLSQWPYYRTKAYAESLVLRAAEAGLHAVVLNPSLLLGPGDVHGSSTGDVCDLLEGRVKVLPPGGISYVDVRDVAAQVATMLRANAGRPGQRYLLTACNETLVAFSERVCRAGAVPAPWLQLPRRAGKWLGPAVSALKKAGIATGTETSAAEMARYYWYADASLAEAELGWAPRDLNQTIHDTVADLRARGSLWPRH